MIYSVYCTLTNNLVTSSFESVDFDLYYTVFG